MFKIPNLTPADAPEIMLHRVLGGFYEDSAGAMTIIVYGKSPVRVTIWAVL